MQYDAFISYSHESEHAFATALQSAIQRFGKPWYRMRILRVFRDEANLSLNSALWSTVADAIEQSDYFILLASTNSARSVWVNREVERWLVRHGTDRLLIVLTDGLLKWDDEVGDFDERSDALPDVLRRRFAEEPLYLDLRWAQTPDDWSLKNPDYRKAIATVSATVRGINRDELEAEEVRQHRVVVRLVRAASAVLVALVLVAAGFGLFATRQSQRAGRAATETLISNGIAAARIGAWVRARDLLMNARHELVDRGTNPLKADFELFRNHLNAPPPLLSFLLDYPVSGFLPGGEFGISIQQDRVVRVDLKTMRLGEILIQSESGIEDVWFSRDGQHLLVAHPDGTLTLSRVAWDGDGERPALRLSGESYVPWRADLSGQTRVAVTVGEDGEATLWDLFTGRPRARLGPDQTVRNAVLNPSGTIVVTGSREGRVDSWSTETGELLRQLIAPSGAQPFPILDLDWSDNGHHILVAGDRLVLIDAESGEELREYAGAQLPIHFAGFGDEGRVVIASHSMVEPVTDVWETETGRFVGSFRGVSPRISNSRFSPYGVGLIQVTDSLVYFSVRIDDRSLVETEAHEDRIRRLSFSADGRYLLALGVDGTHTLWEASTLLGMLALPLEDHYLTTARFMPDGQTVLFANTDGQIGVLPLNADSAPPPGDVRLIQAHETDVVEAVPVSDGRRVVTMGIDSLVKVWDLESRELIAETRLHVFPLSVTVYGSDPIVVVNGTRVWRPGREDTFQPLGESERAGFTTGVTGDGRVCVPGEDFDVEVWDLRRMRQVGAYTGHEFGVTACDFSPDGAFVAAGSFDRWVRVWEIESGELLPGRSASSSIEALAFSPDGRRLALGLDDGVVMTWDLGRAADYERWGGRVRSAIEVLSRDPDDAASLEVLANWYVTREIWTWAAELFEEVRALGHDYESLPAARTFRVLERYDEALAELHRARRRGETDPIHVEMLERTIRAIAGSGS